MYTQDEFDKKWNQEIEEYVGNDAKEIIQGIKEKFGVAITPEQAILLWNEFSENRGATWLRVSRGADIEAAFVAFMRYGLGF